MLIRLMLTLFLPLSAIAETYYIDYQNGSDTCSSPNACENHGISETLPFKTLKPIYWSLDELNPGDKILFKRGVIHQQISGGFYLNIRSSGSSGNPIIIGAYGEGTRPLITDKKNIVGENWQPDGSSRWYIPINADPKRLWLNGDEVLSADGPGDINMLGESYPFYYDESSDGSVKRLYLYSPTNPSSAFNEILIAHRSELITLRGDYIVIENLELDGSYAGVIVLKGSSHNEIRNNVIGNGYMGIRMFFNDENNKNNYNKIYNNIFDSQFIAEYPDYEYFWIGDGIQLLDGSYNEIFNNQFINWAHDGVNITAGISSRNGASYNKVFDNFFTARDISYGRAFNMHGSVGKVVGNEFHDNVVIDMPVRSQLGGEASKIYNNVFEPIRNNTYKGYGVGEAIKIFSSKYHDNPVVDGIDIYHNLFINSAECAISMENDSGSDFNKSNISVVNNIFINTGINPFDFNDVGLALKIDSGNNQGKFSHIDILNNVVFNNIHNEVVTYRSTGRHTISDFENLELSFNDTARDNLTSNPFVHNDYSLLYGTGSSAIAWSNSKSDPVPFSRNYGLRKYSLPWEQGGWMDRGPSENRPTQPLSFAWSFDSEVDQMIDDLVRSIDFGLALKNGAQLVTSGVFFSAVEVDGVDQYLEAPVNSSLEMGTNDLSMMVWVRFDSVGQSGYAAIAAKGAASPTQEGYVLYYNHDTGQLYFWISDGTKRLYPKTLNDLSQELADGNWHHIAVTADRDNEVRIYVDGNSQEVSRADISEFTNTEITNNNVNFTVGWSQGTTNYFKGQLDELRIDSTVLSPAYIKVVAYRGLIQ